MRTLSIALLLLTSGFALPPPASRIHDLADLAWPRIQALDRDRTIVILPVGMIEQHGPHLPVAADTMGVVREARGAAGHVSRALRNWDVLMMPPLNYGNSGANLMGGLAVHPGTYAIRQATLRSAVADIGKDLAENGFKWIFVLNGHAAPAHNIALNEACDFVSETFDVTMLHMTALFAADEAIQERGRRITAKHFSERVRASFGMDVHAGVGETSAMLARRPDLVASTFRKLPDQSGNSIEELQRLATAAGWLGYLSSPSRATAAYGRALEQWWIEGFSDLILRAVEGENMFAHPRIPGSAVPPPVASIVEKALREEYAFQSRLEKWLAARHSGTPVAFGAEGSVPFTATQSPHQVRPPRIVP